MIYKTIQNMVTEMDTQSVIYKNSDYIYIYIIMRHVPIQERTLQRSTIIFFSLLFHYRTKKYKLCTEITIPCIEPRIPADKPFPLSRLE